MYEFLFYSIFPSYTGGSTRLTDICCAFTNYNTPGSNITISGFTGPWAVLNGYWPNGVSCHAFGTDKENSGRTDFLYSTTGTSTSLKAAKVFTESATGSALGWINRFMMWLILQTLMIQNMLK